MKKTIFSILFCFYINVLAAGAIPLNSIEGGKMLASSISAGYAKQFLSEVRYFTYQENIYFCGVASTTILLNTLHIKPPKDLNFDDYGLFTQQNIFTPEITKKTGISYKSIWGQGLTLQQVTLLLNAFPRIQAKTYYANSLTQAQARKVILHALKSDKQFIMVNLLRTALNQIGNGHFSLIAAYDEKSDSVLFMDVAAYKYGPTWISINDLYRAMHTQFKGAYRGFIIVNRVENES